MVSVFVTMSVDEMNGADLQSANAGNVALISPVCANLSIEGVESPSWMVYVFGIMYTHEMNGTDLQRANAGDEKEINN